MSKDKIFIDFDGVLYDTETRIQIKKNASNTNWADFLEKLDWFELLEEAKEINNAIDYLLEAQSKREKEIAILTKVHTLLEMEAKVKKLRENSVELPILFVPPHIKKSQIYVPNNNTILIDDSLKNLIDWEQSGGKGIYFNENCEESLGFETINTLKRIL